MITRFASANRLNSCAVFLASPEGRTLSGTVLGITADGPTVLRGPSYRDPEPELEAALRRFFT